MTNADGAGTTRVPTRYVLGVAVFAWILFVALGVMGLGIGSVVANEDVIPNPRAGAFVGIIAFGAGFITMVVGSLLAGLRRRPRPSLLDAIIVGLAVWVAYIVGSVPLWIEALTRWPAIVMAVAAVLATWGYLAMIARAVRLAGTRDFGTSHTRYRDTGV